VIDPAWLEQVQSSLPELPGRKISRFREEYALSAYDAGVLTAEPAVADYFESVAAAVPQVAPKVVANWISGDLFGLLNQAGIDMNSWLSPQEFAALLLMLDTGEINQNTARNVLAEMLPGGRPARDIVTQKGLGQVSDLAQVAALVSRVLGENPEQVAAYRGGKQSLEKWFFGQVMRLAHGQANPQVVQQELESISQSKRKITMNIISH
jgi:aspartyl-tRNA(Asn)/glutamyl-tRNA(Gln) amidotransferase subunit B